MKTALRTDVGRIRSVNEDRAAARHDVNGVTLALLADGMGGHKAGDIASQTAIEILTSELGGVNADMTAGEWEEALVRALDRANAEVYTRAAAHSELNGMGTTVVVALLAADRLSVAHIGDSRAYMLHQGKLRQLTEDHSLVNELLRNGQISEQEAVVHPRRNVLTRALGTDMSVKADIGHLEWEAGDQLLICSDGLSNLVAEEQILLTLEGEHDLQWKADRLVELALEAGGDDNVTVVLAQHDGSQWTGGEALDRT